MTTVFPVTTAAVVMPVNIASGKFHGAMTTPAPLGHQCCTLLSPGIDCVFCGMPCSRITAA